MRLEFEHNSSAAVPFVENDVVSQDVSSEVERMFREGVRAAQEGKRAEARNLLLRVTESNADNENAWLWLASISEYPEELMVFLSNVLRINPENERALEWNKATKSLLAKTLVQRGMDAASENRKDFARQCFEQALEHEAENEMAWLWMASVSDSEVEKTVCFERVLSINPENETAQMSLKLIQDQITREMFHEALSAAFDGRQDAAKTMLETVLSRDAEMEDAWVLKSHLATSFEERAECFLKLRVLNPENEMAKANLASWRMLADKLTDQPKAEEAAETVAEESNDAVSSMPQTEAFSNDEPAAELNDGEKAEAAEFSETSEEVLETETSEPVNASEFAENSFAEFSEQETTYFQQSEAVVAEAPVDEEFATPDGPTQDLNYTENYAQPEPMNFDSPETAQNEFSAVAQNDDAEEGEEVRFELPETPETVQEFDAPALDLATSTEAEEAQMNWAFSAPDSKQAEDYFQDFDDSDDIHKTQQANYDADDFAPESSHETAMTEASFEMSAETESEASVEMSAEAEAGAPVEEEWRNTAPEVFVNYAPAAVSEEYSEAPTVAFSTMENPVVEEASNNVFSSEVYEVPEADAAEASVEEYYSQQFAAEEPVEAALEQPSMNVAEENQPMPAAEEKSASKNETILCPFCDSVNEKQAFSCNSCHTVLTLSDLEMLLNQQVADADKLRFSVESMERENEAYGLGVEQMTNLGVGHINLKNYRQGFLYLQEAVRMNPSNVLLDAQVNALAIRLSEMEEQQTAHDAMSKNRKILVVDDSPTVRKLISGKLEKCGHEVVCAVDGADALEKIKELKPDLVLLDITMPRMDGYQVCKHIRGDEETKDVPVVMISGKDGFFDKVRGRMAGTSGYITKPFGPETLMKTVETYLN